MKIKINDEVHDIDVPKGREKEFIENVKSHLYKIGDNLKRKKNLSDKVFDIRDEETFIGKMFRFSDVKDHLKKFIDWVSDNNNNLSIKNIKDKIKEIYGEDLI